MSISGVLNLDLHAKQGEALNTEATELLYGGAAGGGKSHLMRVAAILWCASIPGLQVYLFRRIYDDLIKNHMEGPKGFQAMLAPWVLAGFVKIVDAEIRFWNGSKIYLCHCEHEKHIYKYQGAEIHVLIIDELTHFTEKMYRFLRNRLRMVGLKLPEKFAGKFPRILCGANPGNVGHLFVKATFVDGAGEMELRQMPANEGGMLRQYIPARLEDNPSMAADDPGYENRLEGLGSPELVKAMRHGDWDVIEGAYFPEFDRQRHVIKPFEVPESWLKFGSFDWGSAKPFSYGIHAVSDGSLLPDGRRYPTGALIRIRENYGAKAPNVGLKLTVEQVANGVPEKKIPGIKDTEKGLKIAYRVADPAIFSQNGGPSMFERFVKCGVVFRPADNKRVPDHGAIGGWDQLRARLVGEDGEPMLYIFETCKDLIRTLPALQHDKDRPEDVDSDGEDHAPDEERYACMSRPYVKANPQAEKPRFPVQRTINELIAANTRRRLEQTE